jgi:carboxymethylenebutenolidase
MHSETIDIQTPDGTADCYLTRPEGDGAYPGVLFMIDAIGLRPRIEEMADRIARDGYVVLAPNVFYRAGRAPIWETPDFADADARAEFMKSLGPLMAELTADRVAADGGAYLAKLAELADGPVGITGYCMGGRLALFAAGTFGGRIAAMASYHGGNLATDEPDSPHLLAPRITAKVYVGGAIEDHGFTDEQKAMLEKALTDAGVDHKIETYPAHHGWVPRDMPSYDPAQSERHWATLIPFYDSVLK